MKTLLLPLFMLLMYPGKRELFIFYNEAGTTLKNKQLAQLQNDKDGLAERDITIHFFQTNTATAEVKKYRIDTSRKFTIILIGKDGGEKLRSDTVISNEKIFATIDAMPMRKTEMKNR